MYLYVKDAVFLKFSLNPTAIFILEIGNIELGSFLYLNQNQLQKYECW